MSDTPETLAAILAEMRHRAENHHLDGWESVAEELEELCERIDAAAAREYAQWHGETNAAKEERNRIACKMRYEFAAKCRACKSAPGNAAAMRKALERIVGWCEGCHADACEKVCRPELTSESIHAALAALAAPARNCDVGSPSEQVERFKEFCLEHHSAEHLCSECPLGKKLKGDVDCCQIYWAQMLAPAKGVKE